MEKYSTFRIPHSTIRNPPNAQKTSPHGNKLGKSNCDCIADQLQIQTMRSTTSSTRRFTRVAEFQW
jgi:hypothetical protein